MTESGKTTLAEQLARKYKAQQIGVLVLDPMRDKRWNADFITDDPDEFLKTFWASESCAAFIDESGDTVGRFNHAMEQTATKGRHFGHNVHFICQRASQLSKTIRDQCSFLALFRSSVVDCKTHAEEWARDELKKGASLNQGEYLFCGRYSELTRGNVFQEK